ncbi:MAG: NAD-binding protein [Bacteroidota bacterium]
MKLVSTQLSYFFRDPSVRRNTRALLQVVAVVLAAVVVFATAFHYLMAYEGQEHSWITGFYWTLTVMSTLGFGDITFTSDLGRLFSLIVLVSGVVLLLIVLPFAFIRFFYAPWLEAQIRFRAPRSLPAETRDHVILTSYDSIAPGLIERLDDAQIPYVVLEPDPARAADLRNDGVNVVAGELDSTDTHEALQIRAARMLVANREDTMNTSVTLTVREVAPDVPVVTLASADEAEDVLELSGATHVLPLKRQLGEHLANRASTSHAHTHVIGGYRGLLLAELPVRRTPLSGKTIRDSRLRDICGVSVVGVWERGQFHAAHPDRVLTDASVPVVAGTKEQFETLDELFLIYNVNTKPVVVIGGGRVGRSAARALASQGIAAHLVERDPAMCEKARRACETVFEGDAADLSVLESAGIKEAPSVLLTTHDDAMNIYLASYCRRLNPELYIASRITHDRNIAAVHRAGADFVLSYSSLGVSSIFSLLQEKDLVVFGEGLDLFVVPVPKALGGKPLAESGIGAKTGLLVVGVQEDDGVIANPPAATILPPGGELAMLGDADQRHRFAEVFE